jgi:hypothetical protein
MRHSLQEFQLTNSMQLSRVESTTAITALRFGIVAPYTKLSRISIKLAAEQQCAVREDMRRVDR